MVMGNIGSVGNGGGIQGPPGPPGPPGGFDPATSALAVYARAVLPPLPVPPPGIWQPLDFGVVEVDSHQSIRTGAIWRFQPPLPGTYLFQVNLLFQPVGAQTGGISLRFMRNSQIVENEQSFVLTSQQLFPISAQASHLVQLSPGEIMHVELRNNGPLLAQIWPGPPRSSIVIQGVGVGP
ncbi:MAG: hypothetical protein H0X38_00080 [Planctomycetes bacterium]|nr:hypothetical protein [Planctomycetota bacterium]